MCGIGNALLWEKTPLWAAVDLFRPEERSELPLDSQFITFVIVVSRCVVCAWAGAAASQELQVDVAVIEVQLGAK